VIFELHPSCFRAKPETILLVSMANIALKGRHRLYVRDLEDQAYRQWIDSLGSQLADPWNEALDVSMTREAREPAKFSVAVCNTCVQSYEREKLVLTVGEAERLIREPFKIFVENDDADKNFLITFSTEDQAKKMLELEKENLISFQHCGGITELPKKVKNYLKFSDLSFLNCSAIFDSDAPAPGQISNDARKAKRRCDEGGVASHVLRRRAIENYLMRSWLNTWVNKTPRSARGPKMEVYKAFCKLSLEQRSHFHMKSGLSVDRRSIENGDVTLYANVCDADMKRLQEGFGDSLAADLYGEDWVQSTQAVDDSEAWAEVNGMVREILVLCR
jgi:hypothetical protein